MCIFPTNNFEIINAKKYLTMKKIILGLMVLSFQVGVAQKLAYIETDKIVEDMPEFQKANDEIDTQVKQWESEVEAKFQAVEQLYQEYVKNEPTFSREEKKAKQDEIFEVEKEAKDFREQIFGNEGQLKQLQETKIKPLQEKINAAAEKVGKENGYDYVFEKSPESSWIYTNPEHNISELVKAELGLNE